MKVRIKIWFWVVVVAAVSLFCSPFPSRAAVNMYLNIPGIQGDSVSANFTGQIEVSDFSGGITNNVTVSGSGVLPGKPTFADIAITKNLDSASTPLSVNCAQGTAFPNVVLTVTKSTGAGSETAFYTLTMNTVVIKSVQTSINSGGAPMETVILTCGSIQWSYVPQLPSGAFGTPITHNWNIITGLGN